VNRQKKEIKRKEQLELLKVTPIDRFSSKYRFLSNFWTPVKIQAHNLIYQSTEAAYQATKSLDPKIWQEFTSLTPSQAKQQGNLIECRLDWDDIKDEIMFELLIQKFVQTNFKQLLLATSPRPLIEGNNWHDVYWGVCNGCKKRGPHASFGENKLGEMLMKIRKQLEMNSTTENKL